MSDQNRAIAAAMQPEAVSVPQDGEREPFTGRDGAVAAATATVAAAFLLFLGALAGLAAAFLLWAALLAGCFALWLIGLGVLAAIAEVRK